MARIGSEAILNGPVGPTLLRLGAPMVLGILSIVLFQAVDTFFVGQLGVQQLAAMSFTFPVSFAVISVALGLSVGTTAVVAQAIGQGDGAQVKRLTTHALLLSIVIVTVIALLGLVTIRPGFSALGADDTLLPLIEQYMVPWYLAVGFLVIPMVGNGVLRAGGDTQTPMFIMLGSSLLNMVLDPLLIFGWGPFPRLELQGAAIATGIAWSTTLVGSLGLLHYRERLIDFRVPKLASLLSSWRRVVHIGGPAAATNALIPLSTALITRIVAGHGADAVAAFGVGSRVEGLALVGCSALSTAITPFAGQNYGARRFERIGAALRFVSKAALLWGLGAALLLGLGSEFLAARFSDSVEVNLWSALYLKLIPYSYGALGIAMIVGTLLNATDQPLRSSGLALVRLFVLSVPLAFVGSQLDGVRGIFIGIGIANVVVGLLAWRVASRFLIMCRNMGNDSGNSSTNVSASSVVTR